MILRGKILLEKIDLKDLNISNFRKQIGYVTQDPF